MNLFSNFQDGILRQGIYKIQNIYTETYADIEVHSRKVCSRPAENLISGNGLWEIKPLGAGYSIRRVEPGTPDQFCTLQDGVKGTQLIVAAYPAAWRIEIVDAINHRGFEYTRLYWATSELSWAISYSSRTNGTQVTTWTDDGDKSVTKLMWKLIPIEGVEHGIPLPHEEDAAEQPPARVQRAECEDVVTTVTTTTTITTTVRRGHRVEDV